MLAEEQEAATQEHLKRMAEDRDTRLTGENNSGIAVFHDAISTFRSLENQVQALYVRTGVEVLMFAVRSSQEQWFRPYVMTTSDHAGNFFHTCFNQDTETYATRFEAYCLSGIEGVQNRITEEVAALKAQCTAGILAQLNDLLAPTILSKMVYADIFSQITLKHHIIYENWPVSKFCTPGKLTLLELRRLHHVLMNGAPLFRHVPLAEWEGLDLDAFQTRHDLISPTAARPLIATSTTVNSGLSTPSDAATDAATGDTVTGTTTNDRATGATTSDATTGATTSDATTGTPTGNTTAVLTGDAAAAPVLPQPTSFSPTVGGDMLTLDGGMVIRPRQRRRRWDAGLTKEQKAEVLALREAEKVKKTAGRQSDGNIAPE
ncbi:hypothetical protein QCA50_013628 [Cerrena zonata]|uniref:Uncharacterized protein n=1 Tax=Cerrena zonata TaxID=2478898 RepID=A0AAW0FR75_9APHY